MVNPTIATRMKGRVEEILEKGLTIKQVQDILNMHTNTNDPIEWMLAQLVDRKRRGLINEA